MIYVRKLHCSALAACAAALLGNAPAANAQDQPPPAAPTPQTPPAPAPAKGSTTVQGVTVTAEQGGFKTAIDRKSYDLTKEIQAQAGDSIADALRNLPGVQVDAQGDVSIRGDANVVILVDGKPSNQFEGPGKAQALQTLPADQYERVEVMTNPSAEFSPNGSAGIINLISKTSHKPTDAGSVRMMLGADGRWNLGVNGTYHAGAATFTVSAGAERGLQGYSGTVRREGFDAAGAPMFSTVDAIAGSGSYTPSFGRVAVDYDLDPQSRLSANLHFNTPNLHQRGTESIVNDDGGGATVASETRAATYDYDFTGFGGGITYRHSFAGDGHDLTLSASRDRDTHDFDFRFADANLVPASPDTFDQQIASAVRYRSMIKADYEQPMPANAQFKAGYQFDDDDERFTNSGFEGAPSSQGPFDPAESDLFHFDRAIQAFYTTYQQPFGQWTVLGGLRLETSRIDLDQATQHLTSSRQDWRLYPTLHLAYQIDDAQQFIASYSQRIQRPPPQAFDPFRAIQGPLDLAAGNPNLQPQQTQSYEAGYQYKKGATYYAATLYYKDNRDGVTPVEQDIGGGVILTTQENFARSRADGLELVASGAITSSLSYNLSADASRDELDATPLGFSTRQTGDSLSGRGSISWQATPNDLFQLNGFLQGRRLTAQGFDKPTNDLYAGYRHKFSPQLTLFVVGQDLLNGSRHQTILDTPLLKSDNDYWQRNRSIMVGLTWSFGGATKHDPDFDFGNGG